MCHLFNPLLHGFSAAVICTTIFKFCTISLNDCLLNSLPLLVIIDCEVTKYAIQCLKIALIMSEFSLQGILTQTLYYLVPLLIRCCTLLPLISLMSTAGLSLKQNNPNENPMIGLGSVFLYLMNVSKELGNSC